MTEQPDIQFLGYSPLVKVDKDSGFTITIETGEDQWDAIKDINNPRNAHTVFEVTLTKKS